mgnify:CR=1 FL=1
MKNVLYVFITFLKTKVIVIAEAGVNHNGDINLAKIESRPKGNEIGNYIFIVDFDGHVEDSLISDALDELSKITSFLKVLGSYPK